MNTEKPLLPDEWREKPRRTVFATSPQVTIARGWIERKKPLPRVNPDDPRYYRAEDLPDQTMAVPTESNPVTVRRLPPGFHPPSLERKPDFQYQTVARRNPPRAKIDRLTNRERREAQKTACAFIEAPFYDAPQRRAMVDFLMHLQRHGELRFRRGSVNHATGTGLMSMAKRGASAPSPLADGNPLSLVIAWMNHRNITCPCTPQTCRPSPKRADGRRVITVLKDGKVLEDGKVLKDGKV